MRTAATRPQAVPSPLTPSRRRSFSTKGSRNSSRAITQRALAKFDAALKKLPGDPVVHEVRALTLFALGEYKPAAAALNSFLSVAPGMDWTTMSSLYGNADDYQAQFRKLEQYCKAESEGRRVALRVGVSVSGHRCKGRRGRHAQGRRQESAEGFDGQADARCAVASRRAHRAGAAAAPAGADAPETDLVGNWRAKAGSTTIDLAITEDSQFTWKAAQAGKPPVELKGELDATGDGLDLHTQIKDRWPAECGRSAPISGSFP